MKRIFLIVILSVLYINSFCQYVPDSINFIEKILRKDTDTTHIYYLDNVDCCNLLKEVKQLFKYDTIIGFNRIDKSKIFVVFSRKEKKYVLNNLKNMEAMIWADSLFDNSSTLWKDSASYRKSSKHKYYSFNDPIFLREGNLAIFFIAFSCGGLCGETDLSFYIRKEDNWVKYFVFGSVF